MTNTTPNESQLTAQDIVLLKQISSTLRTGLFVLLAAAFGVGVWFARIDSRMGSIERSMNELVKNQLVSHENRLHQLEQLTASGELPKAKERLDKLEERIRQHEIKYP